MTAVPAGTGAPPVPDWLAARADAPPRPRPWLLALTILVAVGVILGVPALAAAVAPVPPAPPVGTPVPLPDATNPSVRVVPPAGWELTDVPGGPGRPAIFRSGAARMEIMTVAGADDPGRYAERQRRWGRTVHDWQTSPAGRVSAGGGFTGAAFAVTGDDGDQGRAAVLGRPGAVVAVWVVGPPGTPTDAVLSEVLASMRGGR